MMLLEAARRLAIAAAALAVLTVPAVAQDADRAPFADARYQQWSATLMRGDRAATLAALERDLRGDAPHPFALQTYLWLRAGEPDAAIPAEIRTRHADAIAILAAADAEGTAVRNALLARFAPDHRIVRDAPMAAFLLAYWSNLYGNPLRAMEYQLAGLQRAPYAIAASNLAAFVVSARQRDSATADALLRRHRAMLDGPVGLYARQALAHGRTDELEWSRVAAEWLRSFPGDAYAYRHQASAARSRGAFVEAESLAMLALAAQPASETPARLLAGIQFDRRNPDAARATLDAFAARVASAERRANLALDEWVTAALAAEDRGRARSALDSALRAGADSGRWAQQYAVLENGSLRRPAALAWAERAVAADTANHERARFFAYLLEIAGTPAQRSRWLPLLERRFPDPEPGLADQLAALATSVGDDDAAIRIYGRVLRANPKLSWISLNQAPRRAAIGDTAIAYRQLRSALFDGSANVSPLYVSRITQWGGALFGADAARATLDSLRRLHPRFEPLWVEARNRSNDPARRAALLDSARRAVPLLAWPWRLDVAEAAQRGDVAAIARLDSVGHAALSNASLNERQSFARAVTDAYVTVIQRGRGSPAVARAGLDASRVAEELGASPASLGIARGTLYRAAGDAYAAALAEEITAYSRPVIQAAGFFMRNIGTLGSARAYRPLQYAVDRDPYDSFIVTRQLWARQLYWASDPVGALRIIGEIRARGLDVETDEFEAWAYSVLGDDRGYWRARYQNATQLSASTRYIGWYENQRAEAQRSAEAPDSVVIEPDGVTATTYRADGVIARRADHPRSGSATLRQEGATWVRAAYDSTGENLTRLETSGGSRIELTYDGSLIARMQSFEGDRLDSDLRFTYGPQRKPTRIALEGVGALNVRYDERGEIAQVTTDGGDERTISTRVSAAFTRLTTIVRSLSGRDANPLAAFAREDSTVQAMTARVDELEVAAEAGQARDAAALPQARLALARRLVDRLRDQVGYRDRAISVIATTVAAGRHEASGPALDAAVAALDLYVTVLRDTRRGYLDAAGWVRWQDDILWLRDLAGRRRNPAADPAQRLLARIEREPLQLAPAARWLPRSALRNVGLWRRHSATDITAATARATALEAVAMGWNGETYVGTADGLAVLRRGHWERFIVPAAGAALAHAEPELRGVAVQAVAAAGDDGLWLGTPTGLLRVNASLDTIRRRWSADDGLSAASVSHILPLDAAAAVGGARGLDFVRETGAPQRLLAAPVRFIKSLTELGIPEFALVGTDSGLYVLDRGDPGDVPRLQRIAAIRADDAAYIPGSYELLALVGDRIERAHFEIGDSSATAFTPLPGQQDIVRSQTVHGLSTVVIDDEEAAAILTDQGLSFYRDAHVEHFDIPDALTDRRAGVLQVATDGVSIVARGDADVWIWERGQVEYALDDVEVRAVVQPPGWTHTLVRSANGTYLVPPDASLAEARRIAPGGRFAVIAGDSGVLIDQGSQIVHLGVDGARPRTLVAIPAPTRVRDGDNSYGAGLRGGAIAGLAVAADGSVWAARGASVFRWQPRTRETTEFSFFVDAARFPSRTHDIAALLATADGRIFAAGSDESHLQARGARFQGGLLEYLPDAQRFVRRDSLATDALFLTATPVEAGTDIIGTTAGFVMMRGTRITPYRTTQDPSYDAMRERVPGEFLGSRGAELEGKLFLFGTANGLVGYHDGAWFVPDRLNRLLPDDHLADYGSRQVNAVAVDPRGRVVVGTARGLLRYDPRGADALSFLVAQGGNPTVAFGSLEQRKLRREAEILLDALPASSPVARRARELAAQRRALEALRDSLAPAAAGRVASVGTGSTLETLQRAPELSSTDRERLRVELQRRERAHNAALAQLERDDRGLFQLLQLNPLDLAAEARQLQPGQVAVQYLPSATTLFIQVLTADASPLIVEVRVPRDSLFAAATRSAQALATQAARGVARDSSLRGVVSLADTTRWRRDLAWLYEQLLRPIEAQLEGRTHVFVVPTGALTYLPFGALRREDGSTGQYAAERYVIGSVPTLYLLRLARSEAGVAPSPGVIVGDPDGSLPSAREEAASVRSALGNGAQTLIGEAATLDRLRSVASEARVLHLATHGVLDAAHPGDSYLLMAGGEHLTVADAMTLGLSETDLVVLSACQSGLGGEGLEYATIARAFAHAGARSVVATLWSVNDVASEALVRRFYRAMRAGDDVLTALTRAQRALLTGAEGDGSFAAPGFWAGYVPFGAAAQLSP